MRGPMTQSKVRIILPPLLCVVLLGGIAFEAQKRPLPEIAEPYHKHVKEVAERLPLTFTDETGSWLGVDRKVQQAAITLLKPNVLIQRQYQNRARNITASLLIVHCPNAQDMKGHYPPVCYPAHGMTQLRAEPRQWQIAGLDIQGMEYEFVRRSQDYTKESHTIVYDFMVMPDGRIVQDMDAVSAAAGDYLKRFYGAGQIQVVFDANSAENDREEAFRALIGISRDLIQAMRSGVDR